MAVIMFPCHTNTMTILSLVVTRCNWFRCPHIANSVTLLCQLTSTSGTTAGSGPFDRGLTGRVARNKSGTVARNTVQDVTFNPPAHGMNGENGGQKCAVSSSLT